MFSAESSQAISTSAWSSSLAVRLCDARIRITPRMTITPTNATQITTITAVMLSNNIEQTITNIIHFNDRKFSYIYLFKLYRS